MRWMSCNYADGEMIGGLKEEEEDEKQGRVCICPCKRGWMRACAYF